MNRCPFCSAIMLQAAKATHGGDLYACLNCLNPCIAYRNGQEIDCREIEDMPDVRMTTEPGTPKGHALTYLSNALDDLPCCLRCPSASWRWCTTP